MNWPMIALLALAAARATYLVTDDGLPFGGLRAWLGRPVKSRPQGSGITAGEQGRLTRTRPQGPAITRGEQFRFWLAHGMGCTHCVSIHSGFWAALLATYAGWAPIDRLGDWPTFTVVWFGISGAVVLLESLHFWLLGDD